MTDQLAFIFGADAVRVSASETAKASQRLFVRSESQLAAYDSNREATGHILTAWETFDAYGLEVMEEAIEYSAAILKATRDATGTALRLRREGLGLSHKEIAKAIDLTEDEVATAESSPSHIPFAKLESMAFLLGLDERLLAFDQNPAKDTALAVRLRTLHQKTLGQTRTIRPGTALLLAESASVIRAQLRLQGWLGIPSERYKFAVDTDYMYPAWNAGYRLAEQCRETLQLGHSPIPSMRELVEQRLGIPVIQVKLPRWIAGATVTTKHNDGSDARGIVLNTLGANTNVWVRRATLAHELGHLLYDPEEQLEHIRVDSYQDSQADAEHPRRTSVVEQRANAFAIAFLAPNDAVRRLTPPPITEDSFLEVMHRFGISRTAAYYHINNSHYRQENVPDYSNGEEPSYEQKTAEDFTLDYFPIASTSDQRLGRFSALVVRCFLEGLISEVTAALYLECTLEELREKLPMLQDIHGISTPKTTLTDS